MRESIKKLSGKALAVLLSFSMLGNSVVFAAELSDRDVTGGTNIEEVSQTVTEDGLSEEEKKLLLLQEDGGLLSEDEETAEEGIISEDAEEFGNSEVSEGLEGSDSSEGTDDSGEEGSGDDEFLPENEEESSETSEEDLTGQDAGEAYGSSSEEEDPTEGSVESGNAESGEAISEDDPLNASGSENAGDNAGQTGEGISNEGTESEGQPEETVSDASGDSENAGNQAVSDGLPQEETAASDSNGQEGNETGLESWVVIEDSANNSQDGNGGEEILSETGDSDNPVNSDNSEVESETDSAIGEAVSEGAGNEDLESVTSDDNGESAGEETESVEADAQEADGTLSEGENVSTEDSGLGDALGEDESMDDAASDDESTEEASDYSDELIEDSLSDDSAGEPDESGSAEESDGYDDAAEDSNEDLTESVEEEVEISDGETESQEDSVVSEESAEASQEQMSESQTEETQESLAESSEAETEGTLSESLVDESLAAEAESKAAAELLEEEAALQAGEKILLDKSSLIVALDNQKLEKLTAKLYLGEDEPVPEITWTSDAPEVANVNSAKGTSNTIKPLKPGTATITARIGQGVGEYASCKVTVYSLEIILDPNITNTDLKGLYIDDREVTLIGRLYKGNEDPVNLYSGLTWNPKNKNVVGGINANGVLTLSGAGDSDIEASYTTDGTKLTAKVTVTVKPPIELDTHNLSLVRGSYHDFTATFNFKNRPDLTVNDLTWTSENTLVATVDENGRLYAATAQQKPIKIKAEVTKDSQYYAECLVRVTDSYVKATNIDLTPAPMNITVGNTQKIVAVVHPTDATNQTVEWSSANTEIASVNTKNGVVTALKAGQTSIFAKVINTLPNNQTEEVVAECKVYVSDGIKLDKQFLSLDYLGKPDTLTATISPEFVDGYDMPVSWEVGDEGIVNIEEETEGNDKVMIISPAGQGDTFVRAYNDIAGLDAICYVHVEPYDLAKATIKLTLPDDGYTFAIGEEKKPPITITITDYANQSEEYNVTDVPGSFLPHYEDNIDASTHAKAWVEGQGNFKGTTAKSHFTIKMLNPTLTLAYKNGSILTPGETTINSYYTAEPTAFQFTYIGDSKVQAKITGTNKEGQEIAKVTQLDNDAGTFQIEILQYGEATLELSSPATNNTYAIAPVKYSLVVAKADFTDATKTKIEVSGEYIFNTQEQEPTLKVYYNNVEMVEGKDFTVSFENNRNAFVNKSKSSRNSSTGAPRIIVTGIGSCQNRAVQTFDIQKRDINYDQVKVILKPKEFDYTGTSQEPGVTITYEGETLINSRDDPNNADYSYYFDRKETISGGTVTVVIQATTNSTNYTGKREVSYVINPIAASIAIESANKHFDGSKTITIPARSPGISLTVDYRGDASPIATISKSYAASVTLTSNTKKSGSKKDANVNESNEYTLTIAPKRTGKYTIKLSAGATANYKPCSKTYTLIITPADMSYAEVTVEDVMYTGKALKPDPVVVIDGLTLIKGEDYRCSYKNNKNAGTATITITGIGACTGTTSATFTINKKPLNDRKLKVTATMPEGQLWQYDGVTEWKPDPIVDGGNCKKYNPKTGKGDYSAQYKYTKNVKKGVTTYPNDDVLIDAGAVTVFIFATPDGNYTGSIQTTYTILPAYLSDAVVTLEKDKYTYTGKKIEPKVTSVTVGNLVLEENIDYKISYGANKEIGNGTVTVAGLKIKNMPQNIDDKSSITVPFKIVPRENSSYSGGGSSGGGGGGGGGSSGGGFGYGTYSSGMPTILGGLSIMGGTTYLADTLGHWTQNPDGRWFYRDDQNRNWTGWIVSSHNWYYLGPDGSMLTGWQYVNGKWYYFHTISDGSMGRMYVDTMTPDGYHVGIDGSWDGLGVGN